VGWWGVFLVVFWVWLCFLVAFGFCLVLVGYCFATVLLEWGVCDEEIVPLGVVFMGVRCL